MLSLPPVAVLLLSSFVITLYSCISTNYKLCISLRINVCDVHACVCMCMFVCACADRGVCVCVCVCCACMCLCKRDTFCKNISCTFTLDKLVLNLKLFQHYSFIYYAFFPIMLFQHYIYMCIATLKLYHHTYMHS